MNQINTLQKEVSSQSYKIRALQLEKRLAQENHFHDKVRENEQELMFARFGLSGCDAHQLIPLGSS